jgi:hypothetical protein
LKFKTFRIKKLVKSDNGSTASFSGYLSTFNNVDQGGDMVMPGAFTKTINDHEASGKKVPILWQHDTRHPIGVFTSMEQDKFGLKVEGELNLEVEKGRECYALMKQGAIDSMSIGYETINEEVCTIDGERVNCLRELKLWEGSMVTFPMNEMALVGDVKALEAEVDAYIDKLVGMKERLAPVEKTTSTEPGPEEFHPKTKPEDIKNLAW